MIYFEFNNSVKKLDNGCWEWLLRTDRGIPSVDKRKFGTSSVKRYIYDKYIGIIPEENIHVTNSCKNVLCVNPEHLEIKLKSEITKESTAKNAEVIRSSIFCKRGHIIDLVKPNGKRKCSICENEARKKWLLEKPEKQKSYNKKHEEKKKFETRFCDCGNEYDSVFSNGKRYCTSCKKKRDLDYYERKKAFARIRYAEKKNASN